MHSTEAIFLNWGDDSGIEVRSTESRRNVLCEAPRCYLNCAGIKVRSTESRREAPWIEVRSTEAFNLNWGDAPTWLGSLLVQYNGMPCVWRKAR